jgi:hypothetical protein
MRVRPDERRAITLAALLEKPELFIEPALISSIGRALRPSLERKVRALGVAVARCEGTQVGRG